MNQIPSEGKYCLTCFCIWKKSCALFNYKTLHGMPYRRLPECIAQKPEIMTLEDKIQMIEDHLATTKISE